MAKPPHNPHDGLFKLLTEHTEAITEVVRERLPANIRKRMVGPVRKLDAALVDQRTLTPYQSDCLLEVTLDRGERAFVYVLMEHKSHPDPGALLQMAGYTVRFWERLARDDSRYLRDPPLVIPMLFYHGKAAWDIPLSFGAHYNDGKVACGMELRCLAVNLGKEPPKALSSHPYAHTLFYTMLYVSDVLKGEALHLEIAMMLPEDKNLASPVVYYMLKSGRVRQRQMAAALHATKQEKGDQIMLTAGEELMLEGKVDTVAQMLAHQFGPLSEDTRERLEAASPAEIDAWALAALSASTLEAVFQAKPSP